MAYFANLPPSLEAIAGQAASIFGIPCATY